MKCNILTRVVLFSFLVIALTNSNFAIADGGGHGGGGSPCFDDRTYKCLKFAEEILIEDLKINPMFAGYTIKELDVLSTSSCGGDITKDQEINSFEFKAVSERNKTEINYFRSFIVTSKYRPCLFYSNSYYQLPR